MIPVAMSLPILAAFIMLLASFMNPAVSHSYAHYVLALSKTAEIAIVVIIIIIIIAIIAYRYSSRKKA